MQATIMIISPVLMAVVGAPYARAVFATERLPVGPGAGKAYTALVWGNDCIWRLHICRKIAIKPPCFCRSCSARCQCLWRSMVVVPSPI